MLGWLGGPFYIALSPVPNFLQVAQDATDSASLTPAEAEGCSLCDPLAHSQGRYLGAVLMF